MMQLLRYVLRDIGRGRWVLLYFLFFFAMTEGLLYFTAGEAKTIVGLMNVVFLLIPLASIMFGTLHLHNSREFIELILTQPVRRSTVFYALYLGVTLPFVFSFLLGVGIPTLIHALALSPAIVTLLTTGAALTFVFTSIAFYVGIAINDKAAGMGLAFILWLFFTVIYDGALLGITVMFQDYPLEQPTIAMVILNPIDLARIAVMLTVDYAALMGYTGAVFQKFFGSGLGITLSAVSLLLWIVIPFGVGLRTFNSKDW